MGVKRIEFWPRQLMRRWWNLKSTGHEFSSSSDDAGISSDEAERYTSKQVPSMLVRNISETLFSDHIDTQEYRISVATWNVAGKSPPSDLDLEEWLAVDEPADVYVIGFQEIVPLNAGNVFGAEKEAPAANKWEMLIRRTLNKCPCDKSKCVSMPASPNRDTAAILDGININELSNATTMKTIKQKQVTAHAKSKHARKKSSGLSFLYREPASQQQEHLLQHRKSIDVLSAKDEAWLTLNSSSSGSDEDADIIDHGGRYVRIASKQMVGIFVTVWARRNLRDAIRNVKASCVGCGLMGYLRNKGSISVSMSIHETSFCFVCSHLTSGEREGDELRRNADVAEILRRTYFQRTQYTWPEMPETILEHDRVIWLGDLNYRLALSDAQVRMLISRRDWQTLLRRDQLKMEKVSGHVFEGWQEGKIDFAPTYKYSFDSDRYFGDNAKPGEKKRTPAWCDRILWYGKGLKQILYGRAESKFSDHRPIKATFMADVEVFEDNKLQRMWTFSKTKETSNQMLTLTESKLNLQTSDHLDEVSVPVPVPVIGVC